MSVHSTSMLVKLTVRYWDGFKKDKNVSQAVDSVYHTTGGAGNYNKRLLDKAVLNPIQSIVNRIRSDHRFLTIPWCYNGVDLLPSKLYFEYTSIMRTHKDAFEMEVANLVQQYPVHKANQVAKLGTMYNPEDYPQRDELKFKFDVNLQFFPVPQEGHFVVDLEKKEAAKLKADLGKTLIEAQNAALTKLRERVLESLEHMHERLSDPGLVFRDSLISNFCQLAEILPGLNIFEDEELALATENMQNLKFVSADMLREDPELRAHIAKATYDIILQLKS